MFYIRKFFDNYFGIPRLAWFIFPLIVLDNLAAAIILNVPLYFEKFNNIHQFETGKIISLYYVGSLIGSFSGGYLTLRKSSIVISSFAMVFYGSLLFLFASISSPSMFELVAIFIGLFGAVTSTSNLSSFVRTSGNKSGITQINLEMVIFNACISVGAYILLTFSIANVVMFLKSLSIAIGLSGLYILMLRKNKTFMPIDDLKTTTDMRPVRFKPAIPLFITVFIVGLIFSMIKVVYTPTVEARFGGTGEGALVASLNPWILLLIQPHLVAWFKGRYDYNFLVMGIGGFLVGLGYFFFGISTGFLSSAMSITILTFGEVIYAPISKNIATTSFGKGKDGFVLGLWRAIFLGSGFIGPIISGWLCQNYGDLIVWELCALLGFLCFVVAVILRTNRLELKSNARKMEVTNII